MPLRYNYKTMVVVGLLLAFAGSALCSRSTSAVVLPEIMRIGNSPEGWEIGTGYFSGKRFNYGEQVIERGVEGFAFYTKDASKEGLVPTVYDSGPGVPERFSDQIGRKLNNGGWAGERDKIGAAYIIFSMMGKPHGSGLSNAIATAKQLYPEWKKIVDTWFDRGLVAVLEVAKGHSFTNSMIDDGDEPKGSGTYDVAWYDADPHSKQDTDVLLFLDSEDPGNYLSALYALRVQCANPLGGALCKDDDCEMAPMVEVKTEIKIGNTPWSEVNMTDVVPGTTVQWRHTITNPEGTAASGTYQIWDNKVGATYTTAGTYDTLNAAPFSYGSNNWSTTKEFKDRGQGTISIVTTGTFTIPATTPEGTTYCEHERAKMATTGVEAISRQLCVRVKPIAVISTCSLPGSEYSIDKGGTQAQSGVINYSQDTGWKVTDGATSTPAVVWARPGDSVQFQHTLCFGAQGVIGDKEDYGYRKREDMTTKVNTATISAKTTPTPPSGGGG